MVEEKIEKPLSNEMEKIVQESGASPSKNIFKADSIKYSSSLVKFGAFDEGALSVKKQVNPHYSE